MVLSLRLRIFLSDQKVFGVIILIYLTAIILLIVASFNIISKTDKALAENQKLFDSYFALEGNVNDKNASLFEEKLNASFSKMELIKITQSYMHFTLFVNGQEVKDISTIYANTKNVTIKFKETCDKKVFNVLPKSIADYSSFVKISDATKILKINTNAAKFTTAMNATDNEKWITYSFSNVNSGEIITVEILNKELARKMGLNADMFEIIYNKAK